MSRSRRWGFLAAFVLVASILVPVAPIVAEKADAAVMTEFNPGYIISDRNFYNADAMSEAQIQQFLEAKVPTCRAAAGAPTCLRGYWTASPAQSAAECRGAVPAEAYVRASRVIYVVAQACGINPMVLLVTLQKEQGLITSTAPSERAYRSAMGYGCPDTAPCDSLYYGFANQMWRAARQFQIYAQRPQNFGHQVRTQAVRFHPNAACGSAVVTIRNQATASLYNYTPYQPNLAAMQNLYGTGDGCSSYGNRNFWRYYTDWFGSPTHDDGSTYGAIWSVTSTAANTVTIRGWAVDSDRTGSSVPINVFVGDGFYGSGVANVTAPEMQNWYTAFGPGHSFEITVGNVPSGENRRICVQAVNTAGSAGVSTVLPCVTMLVAHCGGSVGCPDVVDRVTGANRYAVAADVSRRAFPSGASTAYVTSGLGFADALSASSAAVRDGAPLLLTDPHGLSVETRTELDRLNPARIIVVGGPASVTDAVQDALNVIAPTTRVSGADRFEASRNIAATFGAIPDLYLATGLNFPDALSAGSVGAYQGRPVVLVNGADAVPDSALLAFLRDHEVRRITIAGGPNSVPESVATALTSAGYLVTRLSGPDRFAVSVAASAAFTSADVIYIASGLNYPDALSGSVLAARESAPLMLAPGNCMGRALIDRIHQLDPERVTLLGGPASLTSGVATFTQC